MRDHSWELGSTVRVPLKQARQVRNFMAIERHKFQGSEHRPAADSASARRPAAASIRNTVIVLDEYPPMIWYEAAGLLTRAMTRCPTTVGWGIRTFSNEMLPLKWWVNETRNCKPRFTPP